MHKGFVKQALGKLENLPVYSCIHSQEELALV